MPPFHYADKRLYNIPGNRVKISESKSLVKLTDDSAEHLLHELESLSRSFHWETDAEGLLIHVSPVVEKVTGYRPDELEGHAYFYDLWPDSARLKLKEAALQIFSSQKPFVSFENQMVTKEGSILWILTNGMPILSDDGELLGYRGTDTDITEQRMIREENRRLSEVIRRVDSIVMITDPDQRIEYVNEAFVRQTEFDLDEIRGRRPSFLRGPETDPEDVEAINAGIASGRSFRHEILNYTKSGRAYWIQLYISPVRDAGGEIEQFVSIGTDVTQRRAQEAALEKERKLLSTILRTTPTAITVLDDAGRITFANSSAIGILGLENSKLVGVKYDDPVWKIEAVEGGPFPEEQLPFRRIMETEDAIYNVRHAIRWPGGDRKILSVNGAPLEREKGQVISVVFSIVDVTTEAETTQRLAKALREAEEADLAKSRFLSSISHNLRTPLNGILGISEHLLSVPAAAIKREDLEIIQSCGDEMLDLVLNLLEVATGNPWEISDLSDRVPVTKLPNIFEGFYRKRVENKGLQLRIVDETRNIANGNVPLKPLHRAMNCLLENALIHTEEGLIEIRLGGRTDSVEGNRIQILVMDTGTGILPEHRERIFEPFFQADSTAARKHAGAGLGLPVARQIAESLGGSLTLEPTPEAPFQTSFVLTIPLLAK